MTIIVNGESREVDAATLEALLKALGFEGAVVATAINGEFVPAGARDSAALSDGDAVEIVANFTRR